MSQWLANIFEQQSSRQKSEGETTDQPVPALMIEYQGHRYISNFTCLSEVIENGMIVSYPEKHPAHLGIINLRGAIVPVVCLATLFDQGSECSGALKYPRMVVFNSRSGSFAVGAEQVRKCLVSRETLINSCDIEIDGKIYRVLNESFFLGVEEMVA